MERVVNIVFETIFLQVGVGWIVQLIWLRVKGINE
jgi:hypothetical protein